MTVGPAKNTAVTFEDVAMPDEPGPTNYSIVSADDGAVETLDTGDVDVGGVATGDNSADVSFTFDVDFDPGTDDLGVATRVDEAMTEVVVEDDGG